MHLKIQVTSIILLFVMSSCICEKKIYRKSNRNEQFINLGALSNYVFIGGSQTIILLDSSLNFLNSQTLESPDNDYKTQYPVNWLMIPYGNITVVCNYEYNVRETLCLNYKVNTSNQLEIIKGSFSSEFTIGDPFTDFIPIVAENVDTKTVVFIASSNCLRIIGSENENCIAIESYLFPDMRQEITRLNYKVLYKAEKRVKFKSAFKADTFIYFLLSINNTHSKLGKMCTFINSTSKFNSYEDIPIQCNYSGKLYTAAMDAVFWSEQNYLFVTFSDDSTSVVCRYELQNIRRKFMEARKNRLKCPLNDNNKYFQLQHVPFGSVCFNDTSDMCENTDQSTLACFQSEGVVPACKDLQNMMKTISCPEVTDEQNGFCSTQFFGSVEGNIPLISAEVIYRRDHLDTGVIVKLAAITQKTYAVIYAGTKTGKLGKIFAPITLNEAPFENFEIIDQLFSILDIKISGENVYAMTENMVFQVGNIEACPTSGGCESCIKSKNPFCGWDVLQNSCNKNNSQPFWVPSAGQKCLKLIPKDVQVNDNIGSISGDKVNFKLEPDVFVPTDRVTSCRINEVIQFVEQNYTCGPFVFKESGPAHMALMYEDTSVVNATLNVYKCQDFKSCIECVERRLCFWCPKEFSCISNANSCNGSVFKNGESMCPRIDNSKSLFITENSEENVTLYVPNFAVYDKSLHLFKCVVGIDMFNITAKGDNVTCINLKIRNKEAVLSLQYNSSHQLDHTAILEVYQCQSLNANKNCGYCKYLRSQNYKCDWCENSCESTLINNNQDTCLDQCIEGVGTNLKVYPPSGPDNGGTVLTISSDNIGNPGDNISVKIYGVECSHVNVIQPSSVITCTTGKFNTSNNTNLIISVNGIISHYSASQYYTYEESEKKIDLNFSPNQCIRSGGRNIFITGDKNYFNYANEKRFTVSFCDDVGSCIYCRNVKSVGDNSHKITCRMDKSDNVVALTKLKVIVDSLTTIELQKSFNFVPNPVIKDLSLKSAAVFKSGGCKITIEGEGFKTVDVVMMENVVNPCEITSDSSAVCETPPYVISDYKRRRRSTGQNVYITYDNYVYLSTIYYVEDPVINEFLSTIDYIAGSSIVITGNNLLEGATQDDFIVQIGLTGQCLLENITSENITCQPPDVVPRTNHSNRNIVYVLVQVGNIRRNVGYLKYSSETPDTTILISVLSTVIATAATILIILAVIFIMRRKKIMTQNKFQMELLFREERIRETNREEYLDAQMTIREIKPDLVTSGVPFFDYQTYVFNTLFPDQDIKKHPLLQEPVIKDDNRHRIKEAMVMFDKLMSNRLFLKSVVQTLENNNRLSLQDKAHFACILSVVFLGNMSSFYEIATSLLNDRIQSASKKQHTALFRRFDSITQKLMVNWLKLSLYENLKKQSGMQLFMLYKATQTVVEKGPIDAVSSRCRNTLAEERMLRHQFEWETLTLNIYLSENSNYNNPVTVLDCDTITQVKQKCITAIYKNKPASDIPTVNELELEWYQGRSEKLILQDIDKKSYRSNGMVRLNTLRHYKVKNGTEMTLMFKAALQNKAERYENQLVSSYHQPSPDHIQLLIPECLNEQNQDYRKWHLSNLADEENSQDHETSELFLNRLFRTKVILQDYIDAAFEEIMNPKSLSLPVRYFLCMIDKQAKAVGVDRDVLQSWKSEFYATRVWASLISRPQILFDVTVPSHVESCMGILQQVFIDSFTNEVQNVSKDSSIQKLLFFNDLTENRKRVDTFFLKVAVVSDPEFWRALDNISSVQSREIKFNRLATLSQLYNFIAKYKCEIIEGFGENDETKDLEFGYELEKICEKMEG